MNFNLLSLEESDVENRRVEVHELEDKHFKSQIVFVFRLCPVHFWRKKQEK